MKKMLLSLFCAALSSTAWAQPPQTIPATMPVVAKKVMPTSEIQQVSSGRIHGAACAPDCAPNCVPTKTICVPEPATKKITHTNYSSTCEKVWFPACGRLFSLFHSSCDTGCAQGNCEHHAYQKKYLVKKICVEEC